MIDQLTIALSTILRVLEFSVFCTLLYYIHKSTFIELLRGKVKTGHHYEISVFITTCGVLVFHFIGNSLARIILESGMEAEFLVDVFYSVMALIEFGFMFGVFAVHKVIDCTISKVARLCMAFSPAVLFVYLCLYIERVYIGTKSLTLWGQLAISLFGIITLLMLVVYVIYRILNTYLETDRKDFV